MFRGNHSLPAPSRSLTRTVLSVIFRLLLILVIGSVLLVLLLRWVPPPTSSLMIQRHFQGLGVEQQGNRAIHYRWVPFKAIAPPMALAVIAAEDQKFLGHRGFDFGSIKQALEDQAQGKRLRGASTISQQVAKNLFLWPGRSYLRKGLEAWFTLLMEALWSKQRILEVYLNIAELGERTFGVEAASQRFFGKSAAQLSPQEAALLAAVLPNPLSYRADAPSAYILKRQDWILRQMGQLGGIGYLDNV